jgi:hypothetical protein
MNRTKHMKHKKNTRRRHKLRKPRNTHKRYKKYNRCRTRSQRGGKTKEEVYDEVLSEMLKNKKLIPLYFIHDTFLNFISVYGESDLKQVVCGNYSDEEIRLNETTQLTRMKDILGRNTNPTPNIVKLKDLFLNRNFTQNWTDFVINLKKTVDTRYSADLNLNLNKRMEALNADPLHSLNKGLVSPPSHRVPAAAAAARPAIPAHVQQPELGPPLPEGWTRYGPDHAPFYTNNLTGKSQNEFPTMPAALEKRLAQLKNQDYNPPGLSQEDKRSAKEVGADLPDIPIPSDLLEERLAAAAKND